MEVYFCAFEALRCPGGHSDKVMEGCRACPFMARCKAQDCARIGGQLY